MHELLVIIWLSVAFALGVMTLIFLLICAGILVGKGINEIRKAWRDDA